MRDPRLPIALFLIAFNVYALTSLSFSRTPAQWAASVGTCLALDWLLARLKGLRLVPLSGLVTSLGVVLLCDSPYTWPYAFVAAVSILSKHLIRAGGRHVFNPNNFGMTVGLLYASSFVVSHPGRWTSTLGGAAAVAALGAFAAYRARRLWASGAYAAAFALAALLRARLTSQPPLFPLAPMSGAAFQLFAFYMITDPATSPSAPRRQLVFGASVALLDALLRHREWTEAPFVALLLVCAARPLFGEAAQSADSAASSRTAPTAEPRTSL